ncbi:MAG: 3-methyl-2-oxobutanoate hydroxymethyltransferase [Verrucomicrobia bacterium]|nr:3-methyl-2-oxobutanoate hydroxymethyltransferase [Verrucomicrobiota bacterium]
MTQPSNKDPFLLLKEKKSAGEIISSLTAYDYPTGRLLDEAGIDFILVGDSLGMVFAGLEDTTGVTIEHMIYHTQVVARGVKNALLGADLPYHSYRTPDEALENAQRLMEAGADAVKLEGGTSQIDKVCHLTQHGIPMIGHIGMLPQRVREEGGYKKKGRTQDDAERLLRSAKDLQQAGVGAIVLESVVPEVAAEITRSLKIPTIGIGAGSDCDGQIRVIHDLLGAYPWFRPPFATVYADFAGDLEKAAHSYIKEIQ